MSKQPTYGPNNPHPLSQMRTELVWEGKYDEFGNRREVDVAACAMPMQKIETVDEPRQRAAAEGQTDMFEQKLMKVREEGPVWPDFRNRLIWGDNKLVMASLLRDFKGQVDLIYIDPPFDVGADFTMSVPIGDESEMAPKDQSTLEMVAYRDTWGKGTDSYLSMMYERLALCRALLSETGSIFVHCDWRVTAYLHAMLDDVFDQNFRNEIIWCYTGPGSPGMKQYNRKHDTILWYSKKEKSYKFIADAIRVAHDEKTEANFKAGLRGSGFLADTYELPKGKIPEDWWEMAIAARYPVDGVQRTGYSTEKPWPLLERIVKTVTEDNDLVADFFCGSGTTGAVAEALGRRWLMCDLGRFAIHNCRKRLIELQRKLHTAGKPYHAFDVYNLGRYERQWWQQERLEGADEEHRRVVLDFFKAETLTKAPSPLIHGRKAGAFCHVDGIDSIFTRNEATEVAKAVAHAGGKECYCLSWEFEMDIRLHTEAIRQELGVKLKLIQIPREIMEKNRTSPPPFLEMAVLEAESVLRTAGKKRTVDIKLTKFMPSLAEVPSKELEALKERAVKSGFDFIDFWAVDFNWEPGKPFNHHWQDYRTRKDRTLRTVSDAGYEYPKKGKYTACVKVVDTFGCDTSITVEVKV
jgi:adenine-specific DNA-methyltransferase